ncbi:M50 family metallopeptidase [Halobacillus litoralis]|uniref:M50 family metallopeptidase n=1 Tax=Halobacillus litoralis TaxID=45668 RepID=UPI0039A587BE
MLVTVFLLIFLVAPLSLIIHEFGHVIPGLIFKARLSIIHLGRGRLVFRRRLGSVEINIYALFFQGAYSINERHPCFSPSEKIWISLGGPLLNGFTAILSLMSFMVHENRLVELLFLFNLYLAVVNLLPYSFFGKRSDGYQFIEAVRLIRRRVE